MASQSSNWGRFFWIGLAVFLVGWYVTRQFFRLPLLAIDPWEAVAEEVAVVADLGRLDDGMLPDLGVLKSLDLIAILQENVRNLRALDTTSTNQVLGLLQGGTPEVANWLLVTDSDLELKKTLEERYSDYHSSVFHGQTIYQVDEAFAVTQYQNLLLLGRYPLQVERAVEQLERQQNLRLKWAFQTVFRRNLSPNTLRLYISLKAMPAFLSPFIDPAKRDWLWNWKGIGDWLRLDFEQGETALSLEGQWNTEERNLDKYEQADSSILQLLPNHTALCFWGSWSAKSLKAQLPNDLALFYQAFDGEFAIGLPQTRSLIDQHPFLLTKIKEPSEFSAILDGLQLPTQSYQMFELYESQTGTYFSLVEDYLLICENLSSLQVFLDKYIAGQVLGNEVPYLQVRSKLLAQQAGFIYLNVPYFTPLAQAFVKERYRDGLRTELLKLEDLEGIQVDITQKGTLKAAAVGENTNYTDAGQVGVVWRTALEEKAILAPQLIEAAGEKYVLTQDANFKLYCIDKAGAIQWTRQLDDKIHTAISKIQQEGQTGYFFNTTHQIYLLDQKGEDMRRFPLRLQSAATTAMTLADFDGTGKQHFFVPCANGNIYGFQPDGRPLRAWNPKQVGVLRQPMLHFQHKRKDYLATLNTTGKLQVFRRDGVRRFDDYQVSPASACTFDVQATGEFARIVLADQKGTVHVINLNGENFQLPLEIGKNRATKFAFANVWGDTRKDYLLLSEEHFAGFAYGEDGFKKRFGGQFRSVQDTLFSVRLPQTHQARVGMINRKKEQILLLDEQQRPYPGFPLAGSSVFIVTDLFENQEQILITANENSLYAYRLE